ncbi:MAG: hypothetical protein KAT43_01690 [Nanoarchaeota archaeon]|nr:hypothetical protein [Nanoarchaeota archaeon]
MAKRIRGRVDVLNIKTRHVGMGGKAKVIRFATGRVRPTESARGGGTQEYYFEIPIEKASFDLFDEVMFEIQPTRSSMGGRRVVGTAKNIKRI